MQSPTTAFIETTLNELQITDNLLWFGNNLAFIQGLGIKDQNPLLDSKYYGTRPHLIDNTDILDGYLKAHCSIKYTSLQILVI